MIEAAGKCVVPGLVDAHTHPVWLGDRVHEFAMKVSTSLLCKKCLKLVHAPNVRIKETNLRRDKLKKR